MTYQDLLSGIARYGALPEDVCKHTIGILPSQVTRRVIVAPWWEPEALPALGTATGLSLSTYSAVRVWRIEQGTDVYTYIKTGVGAPILMDVILGLGLTPCKSILFIGSAGALSEEVGIGDIVIPQCSVSGDGASQYLAGPPLKNADPFGQGAYPNPDLFKAVKEAAAAVCKEHGAVCHPGHNFSVDTIFAQFVHLDEIISMGCNVIEMETAAAFRAAALANLPMAALFSISDNAIANKSLMGGRTKQETDRYRFVRRELFPLIIQKTFHLFERRQKKAR